MKKAKILSVALTAAMLVATTHGMPVFAADDGETGETGESQDSCTVTFNTGDLYVMDEELIEQTVPYGQTAKFPETLYIGTSPEESTPALGNYETSGLAFYGWFTEPIDYSTYDLEEIAFEKTTPVYEDVDVYAASWGTLVMDIYDISQNDEAPVGSVSIDTLFAPGEFESGDNSIALGASVIKDSYCFISAEPIEGYYFVGWSTSTSKDDIFWERSSYAYDFEKSTTIYALFDKVHEATVTIHLSTIDGKEADPIKVTVNTGDKFSSVFERFRDDDSTSKIFDIEGYNDDYVVTYKPVTEYSSNDELFEDCIIYSNTVKGDTDVYAVYLKPISSVEATPVKPSCSDSTETHPPKINLPSGINYAGQTKTKDGSLKAWWLIDDDKEYLDLYEGDFEVGVDYYIEFWLEADLGYTFEVNENSITINGAELTDYYSESGFLNITARFSVEHNWGDWNPTTEATATKPDIMTRTCSVCSATEEKEYTKETDSSDDDTNVTPGAVNPVNNPDNSIYSPGPVPEPEVKYYVEADGTEWHWIKGYWYNSKSGYSPNTGCPFHIYSPDISADLIDKLLNVKIFNPATGTTVNLTKNNDNTLSIASTGTKVADLKPGSVIIDVYPSYLDSLEAGEYTLTANFDDGSISIKFIIDAKESAAANVPSTGEAVSNTAICGAVLVGIAVISAGAYVVSSKRRSSKKDAE